MLSRCFFGSLLLAATLAGAAPIKRADIPANPNWVAHLDCDALRETYLGRFLLYQMEKPEFNSNMLAFRSIFSFDLRKQFHGLTLYGNDVSGRDGVYIIYADLVPEQLAGMVMKAEGALAITNSPQVIYSWLDKDRKPGDENGGRKFGAFQNSRMIVASRREGLTAALAVIDGKAPNLSGTATFAELQPAHDGAFLQASAHKLDFIGSEPSLAMLKMARQLKLRAFEKDEQLDARLTLDAGDEGTARQLSIVAQGFIALMSLQNDNPSAAKIASCLSVKQNGSTVNATLAVSSADLIAAIKADLAKKAKKKAGTQ